MKRFREQARSHIRPYSHAGTRSSVGSGLLAKAPVQSTAISRKITPHGQSLVGIGMDSNRSQLKHSTIVQIGDAFSAGLSVAGLVRSVNSNFLVVRGHAWAVWGMVGFFVMCLLVVLPTLQYHPHWFIYSESLFWPLLGLLLINSKGYRSMVGKLVEVRRLREAA